MTSYTSAISERLENFLGPQVVGQLLTEWTIKLVVALVILIVFYTLWRIVQGLMRATFRRKMDETSFSFLETIVKFALLTIGFITALDSAGIKTSALLTSLGIVGLTIGFAARDALSNLISGILIFVDRPFVLGDLVEIEGVYGRVERITLRSTRVVTSDGRMLAVPNTQVINKTVASYTNFPHLRIDVKVTVGVLEDLDHIRGLLLALVQDDPAYMTSPAPRVVVTELNDYNVAVELQAWLDDEKRHVEKRFELREKAFKTLNQAGVELPFETLKLQPLDVTLVGSKS